MEEGIRFKHLDSQDRIRGRSRAQGGGDLVLIQYQRSDATGLKAVQYHQSSLGKISRLSQDTAGRDNRFKPGKQAITRVDSLTGETLHRQSCGAVQSLTGQGLLNCRLLQANRQAGRI